VAIYMAVLVFQTYYALLTMRDNRWGTRDAEVVHEAPCPSEITVVEPEVDIRLVPAVGSSR
jgi:hypothetical protein